MPWQFLVGGVDVTSIQDVAFTSGSTDPTGTTRLNCEGTFYATKIYNAYYNDLAEGFIPEPGLLYEKCKYRILEVNDHGQVRLAQAESIRCVGITSTSYAHCLGASEEDILDSKKIPVGLAGTLWVDSEQIIEKWDIGHFICSGEEGKARVCVPGRYGVIVGKIIELNEEDNRYRVLLTIR